MKSNEKLEFTKYASADSQIMFNRFIHFKLV